MPITSGNKPTRLNIRVSEHEKDVITKAAVRLNTTVSSFVLQRAYADAQAILADQSQFRLPDKRVARTFPQSARRTAEAHSCFAQTAHEFGCVR